MSLDTRTESGCNEVSPAEESDELSVIALFAKVFLRENQQLDNISDILCLAVPA